MVLRMELIGNGTFYRRGRFYVKYDILDELNFTLSKVILNIELSACAFWKLRKRNGVFLVKYILKVENGVNIIETSPVKLF